MPVYFQIKIENKMQIAEQTIELISKTMELDQGASFRQWQAQTLPAIGDAYRGHDDPFRSHLGASVIGKECPREIWYSFRWFRQKMFSARMHRLFNRGHLEEGRIIAMLLMIGVKFYQQDRDGNQFRISDVGGHFGGSGDGFGIGFPEFPDETVLCEFKTGNEKSFNQMSKHGMIATKPEHHAQMQVYGGKFGLKKGMYFFVNKNTDALHVEIVNIESRFSEFSINRARTIINADQPPEKVRDSAGFMPCRFCDFKEICHLKHAPAKNCRTCVNSVVSIQGSHGDWLCGLDGKVLTKQDQINACNNYSVIK